MHKEKIDRLRGAYRISRDLAILHTDKKTTTKVFVDNESTTRLISKWSLGDNAPCPPSKTTNMIT